MFLKSAENRKKDKIELEEFDSNLSINEVVNALKKQNYSKDSCFQRWDTLFNLVFQHLDYKTFILVGVVKNYLLS